MLPWLWVVAVMMVLCVSDFLVPGHQHDGDDADGHDGDGLGHGCDGDGNGKGVVDIP